MGFPYIGAEPHRLLQPLEVDSREARSGQHGGGRLGIGLGERARRAGRGHGQVATHRQRADQLSDPLVRLGTLPYQQGQPTTSLQRAADVGERCGGVTEEHGAGAGDRDIEERGGEGVDLDVAPLKAGIGESMFGGDAARHRDYLAGQIYTERLAVTRDPGGVAANLPGPAADVEHPVAWPDGTGAEETVVVTVDGTIERTGVRGPEGAFVSVPCPCLFGVGRIHLHYCRPAHSRRPSALYS